MRLECTIPRCGIKVDIFLILNQTRPGPWVPARSYFGFRDMEAVGIFSPEDLG